MLNRQYIEWARWATLLNTNCGLKGLDYKIKDLEKVLRENYSLESNEIDECIKYLERTGFVVDKQKQTIKLK